jgi:NAD(P)-dependent dehydrogenase (short-subunit alcohol dehydrogenase family)
MNLNPGRLSLKAASRLINPGGSPDEAKLREAVAGKVVVVTGASYGIGEATARKVGAAGATVLLVARSADRLDSVRADIVRAGGDAHVHAADLGDPERVEALAAQLLDAHGRVDVIVNNAGKSIRRSIALSYDRFRDFERTMAINYLGPVKLFLALLPAMRERRAGHIVNVSTIGVRLPPAPRWAAYQASKAAFDVFFRSAALEMRDDGVTATSIYMPLVLTRMSAPTATLRNVPGLRPDQAADLVCKAIVERPPEISPWWTAPIEAGTALSRRPWEVAMRLAFRAGGDTSSARGDRTPDGRPVAEVARKDS